MGSPNIMLLLFSGLQLVIGLLLFLSEIWVYQTEFAPRISSFMAFPFAEVLLVSSAQGLRHSCNKPTSKATYLGLLFLSLIWMVCWLLHPIVGCLLTLFDFVFVATLYTSLGLEWVIGARGMHLTREPTAGFGQLGFGYHSYVDLIHNIHHCCVSLTTCTKHDRQLRKRHLDQLYLCQSS